MGSLAALPALPYRPSESSHFVVGPAVWKSRSLRGLSRVAAAGVSPARVPYRSGVDGISAETVGCGLLGR